MPVPSLRSQEQYLQQTLSRLPLQFRGLPRLQGLLTALSGQSQDAEAGLFTLWTQRLLKTATGAGLDQLGRVVGQERGGFTDEAYRVRIFARLLVNRSSGTIPELLAIFAILTPLTAELTEYPPAAFELRLVGGALALPGEFASVLANARAAGVGASLLYQTEADANTFTFEAEGAVGEGFPASHPGHISEAQLVSSTSSPVAPLLFHDPPPDAVGPYAVTVTITSVLLPVVDFQYILNDGETPRTGAVLAAPGEFFPLSDAALDPAGLAVSFTAGEPYSAGDTWTWTVGALPGGSLTGILSA